MITLIFSILSFLLPFQLSLHFYNLATYVYGFPIDYLIPTIYITDIVFLVLLYFYFKKHKLKQFKKYLVFVIPILSFVILNILNSQFIIPNIYKWLKIIEILFLILIIKTSKEIKFFKHFFKPLSYSVLLVCLLAIWQFLIKGSVGGLFYFLGERSFYFFDPGIKPYPYSTFSHPNSLSGFLLVFMFLFYKFKNKFNKKYFYSLLTLILVTIFLAHSIATYTALFLTLIIYKFKVSPKLIFTVSLIVSLLMPFVNITSINQSVNDRQNLAKASLEIFRMSPVVGIGFNNFIPSLVNTNLSFENSWQLQPVHNIFLLVLSETGVIGFLFFCSLFFLIPNSYYLIPVALTGLLDHYWLTLQQNQLLLAMIIGFSFGKIKKWKKRKTF